MSTLRRSTGNAKTADTPSKLTYRLASWTVERRGDGWYVAQLDASITRPSSRWSGPFQSIETACLAIARGLCVELADRHTRHIEAHRLKASDRLYGLKPTTILSRRRRAGNSVA